MCSAKNKWGGVITKRMSRGSAAWRMVCSSHSQASFVLKVTMLMFLNFPCEITFTKEVHDKCKATFHLEKRRIGDMAVTSSYQ